MTGDTAMTTRGESFSPRIPLGDRTPVRSPPTTSSPAGEEGRSQSPKDSHQRQRSQGPKVSPKSSSQATNHQSSSSPANSFTPARNSVSHQTIKRVATCGTTTTSELAEKSEGCVGASSASSGGISFRSAKSNGSGLNKSAAGSSVLPSSLAKTIARKTAEELASKESEIQELKLKANENTREDVAADSPNPMQTRSSSIPPPQVKKLEEQSLEDQKESVRKSIVISQLREENTRIANGNGSSSAGGTQSSPRGGTGMNGEPALTPADDSRAGRNWKAGAKEAGRRGSSIPREAIKSSLEERTESQQRADSALKLQRREFQDLEAGTRKLTLMRKDLEDAVSELRSERQQQNKVLEGLKAEIEKLTKELGSLKEKVADESARLEVVSTELEDRRAKEKEAREVTEKLEADILAAQAKLKGLEGKVASEQANLTKVETKLEADGKKHAGMLDEKNKTEAQLKTLKSEVTEAKTAEKRLEDTVKKLKKEQTDLDEALKKSKTDSEAQTVKVSDLEKQSKNLEAGIATLEETTNQLRKEATTLKDRMEEMRVQKNQLAQEINVQNDQIRKFHSDWKESSKELEVEQRKVAGFRDTSNRLQKQIGERKVTLRTLEGRLGTLEAREKEFRENAAKASSEEARLATLRQDVADMENREVELKARLESYYGKTEELSQHLIVMRFARPADNIPASKTHQHELEELPEGIECCTDDLTLRPWSSVPVSDGGTWEQHYEQRMKMVADFRRQKDLDEADVGRQDFEAALMECRIAEQRAAQERIQELDNAIKLRDDKLAAYEAQQHNAEGQVKEVVEELARGECHLRDIESKISSRLAELQGIEAKMSKATDVYERLKLRITVKQREASCMNNQQWLNNPTGPPSSDPRASQVSNENHPLLGEDSLGADRRSPQTLSPYSPRAPRTEDFPERVHFQPFSPCMDGCTESKTDGSCSTVQLANSLNTEFPRDRSWQRELYVKSAKQQRDLFWKERCSSELETCLAPAALKVEQRSSRRATFDFQYLSPVQTAFQRDEPAQALGVGFGEGGTGMLYCPPSYEETTTTPTFREESLLSGRVRSTSSGAGEFVASSNVAWN